MRNRSRDEERRRAPSFERFDVELDAVEPTPVPYLVEKYLTDAETRQRAALAELAKLAPQLMALMKAAAQ